MSSGCYFPSAVREVRIPKKSGGERILGVPVGFHLAVPQVGQLAAQALGKGIAAGCRRGGELALLPLEMAQHVLQPFLDPSEIAGAMIGGCFQPLQQLDHPLLQMGQRRRAVVADRNADPNF